MEKIVTIDQYLQDFQEHQEVVEEIRRRVKKIKPDIVEKISWGMPTFYYQENIIHVAINKKHLGLYPGSEAIEEFTPLFEEKGYQYSKGAVQFPFDQKIPYPLIDKIVRFRFKHLK